MVRVNFDVLFAPNDGPHDGAHEKQNTYITKYITIYNYKGAINIENELTYARN